MRPIVLALISPMLALSVSAPALASLEGRSGLPSGIHLGIGLTGASLDAVAGPVSVGGSVAGSQVFSGMFGNPLNPSARLIWTIRGGDGLSVGLMAAGTSVLSYPPPTPVSTKEGAPAYAPQQPVRVLIGDVGLAVSYRYDFPYFFGRTLPLTFSPTLTFMTDETGNIKFGPQTNLELAARFTPEAELTIGGGTAVGLRFKL